MSLPERDTHLIKVDARQGPPTEVETENQHPLENLENQGMKLCHLERRILKITPT